jgi:hypothetical protein
MRLPKILMMALLITLAQCASAQYSVHGVVRDSNAHSGVGLAAVTALSASDSTIAASVRTTVDGLYKLTVDSPGTYILLYTHPKYADYVETVNLTDLATTIEQPAVALTTRARALTEVIARRGAVRIKGDTTQYLADSFAVDENASVEDLLKVLPGIQVDKDGNIVAQGEQVQKVLVDGDEFFGDDPTIVTKGLQAKTIDKVEVFDDRSETAKFTGFDDGTREKTINLKMKKDMKRGTFGKVEGHTDATKFWNAAAMANAFKNSRRISTYATSSNTGRSGLSWSENDNFGGGNNFSFDEDNGYYTSSNEEDMGGYGGRQGTNGLPRAHSAGVNYSNKWNELKHQFNGNATFKNMLNTQESSNRQTTFQEGSSIVQLNASSSNSDSKRYSAGGRYEWAIDSTTTIVLNVKGRASNSKSATSSNGSNQQDNVTVSSTNQNTTTQKNGNSGEAEFTLKKKLAKKGRTVVITAGANGSADNSDGSQLGNTNFAGTQRVIDQLSESENLTTKLSSKVTYTEPLKADKVLLEVSYSLSNRSSQKTKITNARGASSTYAKIDSLSNDFASNILTNRVGAKVSYRLKKINLTIGSSASYAIFHQEDKVRSLNYDYNRLNFFPQLNMQYKMNQSSNLRFNYNGSTSQPDISQLQNIVDNSDPLNISVGNPNLTQSYRQSFGLSFGDHRTLADRSIWCSVNFSNTFKEIVSTQRYIASTGQNIYSYDNVNGAYNASTWLSYNKRLPKSKVSVKVTADGNVGRNPQFVNEVLSYGSTAAVGLGLGLGYTVQRKVSIDIDFDVNRNLYRNARLNQENKYWSMDPSGSASAYLTKRCVLSSEVTYTWQEANQNFANNFSRAIWDAQIEYRFLKNKNLVSRVTVQDILNQNIGYTRSSYGNMLTESNYLSIRRMALLGIIYNFSFGPAKKTFDEDGDFE